MPSTILVPLDGSRLAERALLFAERIVDARLVLLRAIDTDADASAAAVATEYLDQIASSLAKRASAPRTLLARGEPSTEIMRALNAQAADLVLMATHGRSGIGRWLHGSVADAMLRRSPIPTLLVPPEATRPWPTDRPLRILVPLDGSELGEASLGPAGELARQMAADVVLLRVVLWPSFASTDSAEVLAFDPHEMIDLARDYLGAVAARIQPGLTGRVTYRTALARPVCEAIDHVADEEQVDVIAMATHGRGGLARLVLGSVAAGTLQHARVPLLLTRPTALEVHDHGTTNPAIQSLSL
jgi:nucleotide-binding universal stress UspA family protein